MRRKSLVIFGVLLILVFMQSCKARPEQSLLKSYFHACSLNDVTTMSTMAVDPIRIEAASWSITKVGEEIIVPAMLPEMNQKEAELKKQTDAHIAVTLDAKDVLDNAKDEFNSARTAAARAAAKAKVDEAQKKYDEEYKLHQDMLKAYNDAKAAAAKEEEITSFSLNAGQLANIRELKGNVHSKEVEIQVKAPNGTTENMKITMRIYDLKDEAANISRRGQWKITSFEKL
jgi:hypothetical protein